MPAELGERVKQEARANFFRTFGNHPTETLLQTMADMNQLEKKDHISAEGAYAILRKNRLVGCPTKAFCLRETAALIQEYVVNSEGEDGWKELVAGWRENQEGGTF